MSYSVLRLVPLALLLSASLVYAEPSHDHFKDHDSMMPFQRIEKLQKKLALSQTQVDKIKAVNDTYKAKYDSYREKLMATRKQIKELSNDSAPDYTKIEAILTQNSPTFVAMQLDHIRHRKDIESVLSDSQLSKLKELFKKKWKKQSDQ